jgi:hypothetical protein
VKFSWVCLFSLSLLVAGCSSVDTYIEPGHALGSQKRLFVKTNLNDNHALDEKIAAAFRTRGFEVGVGPETMMPPTTQVVVTYYDQWSWDFKYHLTNLAIRLRDAKTQGPLGLSEYVGPAAMTATPEEVIERLVKDLLNPAKAKAELLPDAPSKKPERRRSASRD